ncbi:hypothetical protein [Deinococcus multiflagellatus]|nr:hypothetical protein [Deinococcus multiflagellatus]MBZ9715581.1 hypothetical protein [Deinococcus multiflagellatus]
MTNDKKKPDHTAADAGHASPPLVGMPRWVKGFLWVGVALLLVVLALKVFGGGQHGPGRHLPGAAVPVSGPLHG